MVPQKAETGLEKQGSEEGLKDDGWDDTFNGTHSQQS